MLKDYEIYRVKRGDTMWHITRRYYGRFTVGNVCFYIDHLFSPLNDKGYMEDYKLGQYDRNNPHLIYPDDELKVPVLTKADPLAIPGDIKDIIGCDCYSDIYTAKGTDGKIIIANFTKRKVAIASMDDMLVAGI